METLDEEFLEKLRMTSDLRISCKKYKEKLQQRLMLSFVFLLIILFFIIGSLLNFGIHGILTACFFALIGFIPLIIFVNTIRDLLAGKLDVTSDTFMGVGHYIKTMNNNISYSHYTVKLKQGEDFSVFSHSGDFDDKYQKEAASVNKLAVINIEYETFNQKNFLIKMYKIPVGSKIFVVRTGRSKTLLDVIPESALI
jgi:hypothetical protein